MEACQSRGVGHRCSSLLVLVLTVGHRSLGVEVVEGCD